MKTTNSWFQFCGRPIELPSLRNSDLWCVIPFFGSLYLPIQNTIIGFIQEVIADLNVASCTYLSTGTLNFPLFLLCNRSGLLPEPDFSLFSIFLTIFSMGIDKRTSNLQTLNSSDAYLNFFFMWLVFDVSWVFITKIKTNDNLHSAMSAISLISIKCFRKEFDQFEV